MKPELEKLYIWDGSPIFKDLRSKRLGKGVYRYAKNITFKGETKTLILLSEDPSERRIDDFLNNASRRFTNKDKALFAKSAAQPVLTSIEYA